MKNLPIGMSSFKDIRTDGYLYVDKTQHILRMIQSGRFYFLARPRRFGKSLLVSTMEQLFRGNKDIFQGLYVHDQWDWNIKYPVIKVDCSVCSGNVQKMENTLKRQLGKVANAYNLSLTTDELEDTFDELIGSLYQTFGQQVVILIDEYDAPLLAYLGRSTSEIDPVRNMLHDFYKIIKANSEFVRFVFITGISKFAGVSIFSALNNLNDNTFNPIYNNICGYTQRELEDNFMPYIENLSVAFGQTTAQSLDELKYNYNGYSWDGVTTLYNPISVMTCFDNKKFGKYWFATGTPTFLIDMLKKNRSFKPILQPVQLSIEAFGTYQLENIDELPLLFQTGYLTVKHIDSTVRDEVYTLATPNREVQDAMLKLLLVAYTGYPPSQIEPLMQRMYKQLESLDATGLTECLRQMLSKVPYSTGKKTEAWYHDMTMLWLTLLGFDLAPEVITNIGRIDAVWHCPQHTIIVEVKRSTNKKGINKLLDGAIQQIRDNRYYERFMGTGTQISLMGIAFAGNDVGCKIEKLWSTPSAEDGGSSPP